MADPVTAGIAVVGMAASAASGVVGAQGSKFEAQAKANQMQYQAGITQINEKIAKQNEEYERVVGGLKAQQFGAVTRERIARMKVGQSASGIDLTTGSPAEARRSQQVTGQVEQRLIRSDAARRAYGHVVEAKKESMQGKVYSAGAKNAITAGDIGATQSILGGVSSVSSKWMQAKQMGTFA